jgi:4-amino-4-deoxy-L-arabinose transferase-like glycosyltransferase
VFGGVVMGSALGTCFLAGGLGAVLPPLTLLALPLMQRRWIPFGIAIAIGAVIAGTWLLLLLQYEPTYLEAWWTADLTSITPRNGFSAGHAKFLGWVTWPVLFIAPWAIWRGRHQLASRALLPPVLGLLVAFVWFLAHEAKTAAILPLMPPLILLAATGTASLRRGAANAWDWFGMMTLSIAAALVWLGFSALQAGWPEKIAANAARLEPGFVGHFSAPAFLFALAATIAWVLALMRLPRSPWRVVSRWAAGVTIAWTLLVALLMPWIDYGKTYRPVIASLRHALPEDTSSGCIGRLSLGAPQRAALDYFGGIRTRWGDKVCPWLIMQGGPEEETPDGWTKTWEGHRPGDRSEWLRLYRHSGP